MADLFEGGPPLGLQNRLGLIRPGKRKTLLRAFLVAAIAWMPLIILSAARNMAAHDQSFWFVLKDLGVLARFLIAAPLLVAGESWCLPTLSRIPQHFLEAGLVDREEDRTRLRLAIESTARRLNSTWAEIFCVVAAYGLVAGALFNWSPADLPPWHVHASHHGIHYSAAGIWHALVSLPILFVLLLGWLWRQFLWWKLMLTISRLDLRLIAAHPDRSGGLRFLSTALRGYWPLAFAISTIVAGRVGNQIREGFSIYDSRFAIAGIAAFVLVLFLAPFTAFVPNLIKLKETGTYEYDTLAQAVGEQYEQKWLAGQKGVTADALDTPEFSATTDLYSIVANVHQIGWFPVDFVTLRSLAVATMLPFLPLPFFAVPVDVIVRGLGKLLL